MDYFEIGQRIRKIRKARGLSQEQLAELIGISTTHMSHIEIANTKLSLPVFVEIAKVLEVQTDSLLYPAFASGQMNVSELARICGLSRPTVYKYLKLVGQATKILKGFREYKTHIFSARKPFRI